MGWVGAGLQILGTIRGANQSRSALKRDAEFQQIELDRSSTLARYEQRYNENLADLQKSIVARQYRKIAGRANVANATSGFDASSTSSQRAVDEIIYQAELDAASIDAGVELSRFRTEAEISGNQAAARRAKSAYGDAAANVRNAAYFRVGSILADEFGRQRGGRYSLYGRRGTSRIYGDEYGGY